MVSTSQKKKIYIHIYLSILDYRNEGLAWKKDLWLKNTWDLSLADFAQLQSGTLLVTSFTSKVWPAQNNEVFFPHKEQFSIKWRFAITRIEFVTSIVSQFQDSESFTQEREMQPNYYTVKMTQAFPLTQHKCRHFAMFCPLGCFFSC